jgi:hypothetical protein
MDCLMVVDFKVQRLAFDPAVVPIPSLDGGYPKNAVVRL